MRAPRNRAHLSNWRGGLQSFTKFLRLFLVFMSISALMEILISISQEFLLVLTEFSFCKEDWTLSYHSMKIRHFPNKS